MLNAESMPRSDGRTAVRAGALVPALLAALLGLFVIWGVGFAGPSVIHNAAHDARHANGFPCH
ncbi:MAG: CbtB-domain containing protein [Rhodospirillaceae bacterium]|nr:CbtB-domain containing protein [Rhodospirillaceae bacterium]